MLEIKINPYSNFMNGNNEKQKEAEIIIEDILKDVCKTNKNLLIETYSFKNMYGSYKLGSKYDTLNNTMKLSIMNFYSHGNASDYEEKLHEKYGVYMLPVGDGILISDKEGYAVAEYRESNEYCMLNILVDVFGEEQWELFKHIMEEYNRIEFILPLENINSWKKTNNKELLMEQIKDATVRARQKLLYDTKTKLDYNEKNIEQYKTKLKREYDYLYINRNIIEQQSQNTEFLYKKIINDINLMIENEKINDVDIHSNKIKVITSELTIHASNNKDYYGGIYEIEIPLESNDIRFFNKNGKRGYWTDNDPHPHVSGRDGRACLGNIDSTIAELSAQKEFYAIALICIDFLENTNVSDSAGQKVINWDRVIDGKIIKTDSENKMFCKKCDEYYDENEVVWVYDTIEYYNDDEYNLIDGEYVCKECRNKMYEYDENSGEYARNIYYYENEDEDYEDDEDDEGGCY